MGALDNDAEVDSGKPTLRFFSEEANIIWEESARVVLPDWKVVLS